MMKLLLYVFTSLLCMACAVDDDYWSDPGSGSDDQQELGFCVEVIAYRLNQFYIYWIQPDIDDIEYYEVSYNVSVRYQTAVGERIFNSSNIIVVNGADPKAVGIPLYTENSTYTIRVVAVTSEGTRVSSNDTIIPEERFRTDHRGRDDAITFFQLGLDLVESNTMKCSEYEDVYESTLSLIRSQVTHAMWSSCNEVSTDNCDATLENDEFSCYNNSRLMYTARIVATGTTNATTFLRYLSMAGIISMSLHNGTNFTNTAVTSSSCSLSIPSPDEANCTQSSSLQQPPAGGYNNESNTTSDQGNSDSDSHDENGEEGGDSIAALIAVAIGCSVGIVAMAACVMFTMFVCNRCSQHCHDHKSSSNVEKGSYWDVSSYTVSNQDNRRGKTPPNIAVNYPPRWCAALYNEYPSGSLDHHCDNNTNDTASIKSHDHYRTNHVHS